jgi:hypothetical protein
LKTTSPSNETKRKEIIMTELAISGLQVASSVVKKQPRPPKVPKLKPRFTTIMLACYKALIHSTGVYKAAKMETHAPQVKFYPGSPAFQKNEEEKEQANKKRYENLAGMDLPSLEEIQAMIAKHLRTSQRTAAEENQLERLRALARASKKRVTFLLHKRTTLFEVIERGTPKHFPWLWFTTLTDRREISERVYEAHCRIYADHPELYDRRVLDITPEDFKDLIRKGRYKIGSPYQSAENWLVCAKTLFGEYDGDPVALLKDAGWSVEKVYAWKAAEKKRRGYDPIPGWGRKLLSLYFLYLAELGYQLPDDAYPADVHAQAIAIQTDCVDFARKSVIYTSALAEMVRAQVTALCREKNLDPVIMAHASWLLGSQLCTKCSGNAAVPDLCPIYSECKGRADTSMYFARGRWPKKNQIMVKGGVRPEYGLPTEVKSRTRSNKKGIAKRDAIGIIPLFSDKKETKRKVIPITPVAVMS